MSFESIYCYPDFSEETFQNRVSEYVRVLSSSIDKAESLGLIPENIEEYYSSHFSRHNDNNV